MHGSKNFHQEGGVAVFARAIAAGNNITCQSLIYGSLCGILREV